MIPSNLKAVTVSMYWEWVYTMHTSAKTNCPLCLSTRIVKRQMLKPSKPDELVLQYETGQELDRRREPKPMVKTKSHVRHVTYVCVCF